MTDSINYLLDHTPPWIMIVILLMSGFFMFGPKYVLQWVKVRRELSKAGGVSKDHLAEHSEVLLLLRKNIDQLENDKERLQDDVKRERDRVESLKREILRMEKQITGQ